MVHVNVRSVGAKGDGITNDTVAFRNAMDAVLSGGGGTIIIPPGRYVVGCQDFAGAAGVGYAYRPQPILFAARRTEDISIRGAGEGRTVLLAAPGLKIGAFDPVSGAAFDTSPWYQSGGTFTDRDYTAQPYYGMIDFEYNDGDLEVRELTLDGNINHLDLGGDWSDPRFQLAATGILLVNNRSVLIENVTCRRHGLDGISINWKNDPETPRDQWDPQTQHVLRQVTCEENARTGLGWVGGKGLTVTESNFDSSGRARFTTTPASGLDIEPDDMTENPQQGRFTGCTFRHNAGHGMLADYGGNPIRATPSIDVSFADCLFVGSPTAAAIYPNRPGISFEHCQIYGWSIFAFGSRTDPTFATTFHTCEFEDKADYEPLKIGLAVVQLSGDNIRFTECSVTANAARALLLEGDSRKYLTDCDVTHRWGTLVSDVGDSWQSALSGTTLEDVRFHEQLQPAPQAGKKWYISVDPFTDANKNNVTIDGPFVRWGW